MIFPATRLRIITGIAALLVVGCNRPQLPKVAPAAETEAVFNREDAADDPAIWVHPVAPESSLIIGTDKNLIEGGLHVFDLTGKRISFTKDPGLNNVDLRDGFDFGDGDGVIVAGSRRTDSTLALYRFNPYSRSLERREARAIKLDMEPYGLCLYRSPQGETFAFVGDKSGRFVQLILTLDAAGRVDASPVRSLKLSSQSEGCVADDASGHLYIAEERGILWRFAAAHDSDPTPQPVDSVHSNKALKADLEGVAVYANPEGGGYLVVSSQGNNSYALYDRKPPNRYFGSFRIGGHDAIDGVSETDGLEVVSLPLGPTFPKGALVVQDGDNGAEPQNFKMVNWREIERTLKQPEVK